VGYNFVADIMGLSSFIRFWYIHDFTYPSLVWGPRSGGGLRMSEWNLASEN